MGHTLDLYYLGRDDWNWRKVDEWRHQSGCIGDCRLDWLYIFLIECPVMNEWLYSLRLLKSLMKP